MCESGVMVDGYGAVWGVGQGGICSRCVVVDEVDFSSVAAAKEWLEGQTIELCCAMSSRAALRVCANLGELDDDLFPPVVLASFRAILTSAVRSLGRTADVDWLKGSAHSAAFIAQSAYSATHSVSAPNSVSAAYSAAAASAHAAHSPQFAGYAAISAGRSADSAARFADSARFAASFDTAQTNLTDYHIPLWAGADVPPAIQEAHERFLKRLNQDRTTWGFWHDWYLAMWEGRFDSWDFATEVAKIPDEVWDEGPEAVTSAIRLIERQIKTSVSPRLVKNNEQKWDVERDASIPQEPLDFAIAQVELSLKSALAPGQSNGLTEKSSETVLIRGGCGPYRNHPSVVATSFWNACMSLQRNIGDIYPETASLIVLQNVLYTSVEEICAQDELISARIAKLAVLETRRIPTPQEKEDLAKVPDLVADETTIRVQEELREMVDIIRETDKSPRFLRAKLVNWITTLGSGIDKAQKNEKRAQWLLSLARRISGWFFDEDGGS